jgi:hypothetical protein
LPMYIPHVSHDMWKWDTPLQSPRYHINSSTVTLASQGGFDVFFFFCRYCQWRCRGIVWANRVIYIIFIIYIIYNIYIYIANYIWYLGPKMAIVPANCLMKIAMDDDLWSFQETPK